MKARRVLLFLSAALFFSACSTTVVPDRPQDFRFTSAELFLSRTNLTETEFEQFNTTPNKIFVECGRIVRGRFVPLAQNVFGVSEAEQERLREHAWVLLQYRDRSFDKPGDNSSMIDPGQLTLTLNTSSGSAKFNTSVDSVSMQSSKQEAAMYQFVSAMRKAAGSALCGNKSFYGLR